MKVMKYRLCFWIKGVPVMQIVYSDQLSDLEILTRALKSSPLTYLFLIQELVVKRATHSRPGSGFEPTFMDYLNAPESQWNMTNIVYRSPNCPEDLTIQPFSVAS